jgi:hypothetical protein
MKFANEFARQSVLLGNIHSKKSVGPVEEYSMLQKKPFGNRVQFGSL